MGKGACSLKSSHRSPEVTFEQTLEGEGESLTVAKGKSPAEGTGKTEVC